MIDAIESETKDLLEDLRMTYQTSSKTDGNPWFVPELLIDDEEGKAREEQVSEPFKVNQMQPLQRIDDSLDSLWILSLQLYNPSLKC
ncbi:hypothetical protein PPACK8108_LOCUS21310 [Phakopsora pachyrhizi]|uniref:Uncharacterized protein n=1 Tax=Phakopsora pachyrhizi TaxID=170000 RepID=A0AAV0BKK0_PHAPC|nr:hypothetical protein PPACK8108_LOCUS21310 [Phakopsora pachyrhizi]